MDFTQRASRLLMLAAVIGAIGVLAPGAARAQVMIAPGESFDFLAADRCGADQQIPNAVESLARADSTCSASARSVEAEVRPILGAGWVGLQTVQSWAWLQNDFEVPADPGTEGNTVGTWVSYDVDWNGLMLFIGFFSNPTVEYSVTLKDLTDNKDIKGELIWGRDGSGVGVSIPYIPFELNLGGGLDAQSVSNTFSAVLTRGHAYRLEFRLTCSVFSDGGLDVGTECDYMNDFTAGNDGGAGWSKLTVKVGLDEAVVLDELAEIGELREELEKLRGEYDVHGHPYLTGRGVGHNNTEVVTGTPEDGTDGSGGGLQDEGSRSHSATRAPAASRSPTRGGSGR